ncbi:MAG TPA: PEP-CTERM sorting domain-containing protein, partial [Candidatus Binatia bacterium]|nr:PEP-CTERM sorting domain-containing protein [Candidatus Binatia bacterium]
VTNGGAGQGAMVAIWRNDLNIDLQLDPAVNLGTNCTSFTQCIGEATEGTLLQVDGFAGDRDEFWTAVVTAQGGLDVGTVAGLAPNTPVAQFFAALTTFENNIPGTGSPILFMNISTGLECPTGNLTADGCVAGPTLSGQVLGGSGLNSNLGAFARSDTDAQKLTVPAPATLALLGIGLLGSALALRRRRV